ncbi:MAG: hypothetical protein KAZ71_07110 [Bacteroidia bacterium]|nr:hypothetical protein [Bacteroidia bacterium]
MEKIYTVTIIIHVLAGIGALIFGALAIILKKNTPKHKPVGRFYFYCMTTIFATGVFLSVCKGLLFLFFIAIFTYYSTIIAYRALRLKNLHNGQKPAKIDWIVEAIAGITFIGLIIFAIHYYIQHKDMNALIPLTFGTFGLWGVIKNTQRLLSKPKETLYWLKMHIGNMLGSYIGAITAFVVNQAEHIPLPQIVLWLGPAAILVPIIVVELKKVKSKPL